MSEENTEWRQAIPEQYHEMGVVKEADSMEAVFQRVQDLNEYRGNSIRIPGEDASTEQMLEFTQKLVDKVPGVIKLPQEGDEGYDDMLTNVYQQLGRPGEASGYTITEPPEGVSMEAEGFQAFGELAHSLGLTQKQFDALAKRELESTLTGQTNEKTKMTEAETAIKAEFGAAYEGKTNIIKDFLAKNFPSVKDTELATFGLETCKEFLAMAEKLNAEGGSSIDTGLQGQEATAMTPGEAQARITEIRNNSAHPYHNRADPGHNAAQEQMRKLYQYAHGTKPADNGVSMSISV